MLLKLKCCEAVSQKTIKRILHPILGYSFLKRCINCNTYFYTNPLKITEKNFSKKYVVARDEMFIVQKKMDFRPFKSGEFFIDYSRFELIAKFLDIDKVNKIMEIGPGYPGMLPFFNNQKNKYYISEPNNKIVKLFSEHKIKSIDYQVTNRNFDLIICPNVIYYFTNIDYSLTKIKKKLATNGLLFIDILNSNILNKKYFEKTDQINIFSKKSIEHILIRNGFEILSSAYVCSGPSNKNIFKNQSILQKILNKIGYMSYKKIIELLISNSKSKYLNSQRNYLHIICKKN